jgi:hypothetical protein
MRRGGRGLMVRDGAEVALLTMKRQIKVVVPANAGTHNHRMLSWGIKR